MLVRRSAGQGHGQKPPVTLPRYATLESVWPIESPSMGLLRRPPTSKIVEDGRFSRPYGPGAHSRASEKTRLRLRRPTPHCRWEVLLVTVKARLSGLCLVRSRLSPRSRSVSTSLSVPTGRAGHRHRPLDEALDEGQGGVGDFTPAAVDDQRVPAVLHLDDLGHALVVLLLLVGGVDDRPGDGVILLPRDEQQRPPFGVVGVDLGLGPGVEVG